MDLACEPAPGRPRLHLAFKNDGRRSVLVGRGLEICVCKPGGRALYETGNAVSPLYGRLRRLPRDRWGIAVAFRPHDAADRYSVHHRDGRGDTLDENLV